MQTIYKLKIRGEKRPCYSGPSFSRRNFRGPNCNGSNCSEANCQEPSCPGPNIAERLHKAELSRACSSEPSFPNTKI